MGLRKRAHSGMNILDTHLVVSLEEFVAECLYKER